MVSRNYSDLTLKKLYGLSGNVCAFPECNQTLISENKTNLSDICHIEGGEEKSPRYNSNLSLQQLNDYENLVIMCKNHNKYIDDNVNDFSVDYLKKIKQIHEKSMKSDYYEIPKDVVDKIIQDIKNTQVNIQTGSGTQIISQVEYNIQNMGITSISEIENLIEILFEKNFPQLQEIAQKTALESVKKYWKILTEKSKSQLSQEDIKQFSDPDVQYMLTKTVIEAGRKNDDELLENLAMLMVDRIKNSNHDLKRLVYNEAIETLPKLTQDELKIIAACFSLFHMSWPSVNTLDELKTALWQFNVLFDIKNTSAEFDHIAYTGCGIINTSLEPQYFRMIVTSHVELFSRETNVDIKSELNIPDDLFSTIFVKNTNDQYVCKFNQDIYLDGFLQEKQIDDDTRNRILVIFRTYFQTTLPYQGRSKHKEFLNDESMKKIINLANNTGLYSLRLTSVGKAIGLMYCKRNLGIELSLDTWIN